MIREFGRLADGRQVDEIQLKKGELEASVLTYGAIIRDLRFRGQSVVLGFEDLDSYLEYPRYFGAIAGRCANRIRGGRFSLDGQTVQLGLNEAGKTHLHGGTTGFSQQLWSLEQHDKASVLLKYVSVAGEEGYPGTLETLVRYTLTGSGAVRVKITATTDAATPVNIVQHSYFNLDGSASIRDHVLEIAADTYLPIDADKVPTGAIRNVAWTPFDFREGKKLGGGSSDLYDHNYCLAPAPRSALDFAAALEPGDGDIRMEVWTTEPGVQLYDGAGVDCPLPGLGGKLYGRHAGVCLEPQRWPDAVNHPEFPNVILRPEETYTQLTEFRFT